MRSGPILVVLVSILSFADSSLNAKRDAALKAINACIQRDEVSSRECRTLNANVQTLVEVYKQGDKSVLPTLLSLKLSSIFSEFNFHFRSNNYFRFKYLGYTYLSDFYREAFLNDPVGLLTAMSQLPDKDQEVVADDIAGGEFGIRSKEQFERVRALLSGIPDSEPIQATAQLCLKALERLNVPFLQTYFPPKTFVSRDADFQVRWYSQRMYALGEKPLWPPSGEPEATYRLTYMPYLAYLVEMWRGQKPTFYPRTDPASMGPTVITLSVRPGGEGRISIKTISGIGEVTKVDETRSVTGDQLVRFFAALDKAHFWTTPTELPGTGVFDADWIMEAVKDGKYRAVMRPCIDSYGQSAEENQLAKTGRLLFEIAGHKRAGIIDCVGRTNPFVEPDTRACPECNPQ